MAIVSVLENAAEESFPGARVVGMVGGDLGRMESRATAGDVDYEVQTGFVFQKADLGFIVSRNRLGLELRLGKRDTDGGLGEGVTLLAVEIQGCWRNAEWKIAQFGAWMLKKSSLTSLGGC